MAFYCRRPRPDAEKCADPAKARASALETLAGQEVSANMLYERLCRRYTEQAAAAAVAEMVQLDYVNDARYAEARAHSLLAARKSRRAAAQSLRQKGLAPAEVAGALEAVYAPEDGDDPELEAAAAKNWPSAAATLWWPPCSAAALPTPSSRKPSAGWRRGNDPPVKIQKHPSKEKESIIPYENCVYFPWLPEESGGSGCDGAHPAVCRARDRG